MTDTDLDVGTAGTGDAPADAATEAWNHREERAAEFDAKLDAAVRESARQVYAKQDHAPPPPQQSLDVAAYAREDLEPPFARDQRRDAFSNSPSMQDTMRAQMEWDNSPKATQNAISHAHAELASLKQAAGELRH